MLKSSSENRSSREQASPRGWLVQERVVAFMDESGWEALHVGQVSVFAAFAVSQEWLPRLDTHANAIRDSVRLRHPDLKRPKAQHLNTEEWKFALDVLKYFRTTRYSDSLCITKELIPKVQSEAMKLAEEIAALARTLPPSDLVDPRVETALHAIQYLAKERPIYLRRVGYVCKNLAGLFRELKLVPQLELVVDQSSSPPQPRENWDDAIAIVHRLVLYSNFADVGEFSVRDVFGVSANSFYTVRTSRDIRDSGLFFVDLLAFLKRSAVEGDHHSQDWKWLNNYLSQDPPTTEPRLCEY